MTDQDKIIIESDSRGRIRIGCEDAEGDGHGYRLAGPKYSDGGGKTLARVELGERDVTQIRLYLSMWGEANGAALPTPPAEASKEDELRQQLYSLYLEYLDMRLTPHINRCGGEYTQAQICKWESEAHDRFVSMYPAVHAFRFPGETTDG